MKELVAIRYGRMLQSPFAFYRGSAGIMASDLARMPSTGLKVQACGDCHVMNFGGFLTPERNIIFDINDFDETSPAPWDWDVKRLVGSVALAARANNYLITKVANVQSLVRGATASTCSNSQGWIPSVLGIRRSATKTSSERCQRV
jgi:uncharacterized protein (DUF2252 family)